MIILGIDPATTTGYAVLKCEGDTVKVTDFGRINIPTKFSLPQRLNFIHQEIERLIDKVQPDHVILEDVILGVSGVKILAYLARLNGVILQASTGKMKDCIHLVDISTWKSNSIPNINTKSPKWRIQLECARYFGFHINDGDFKGIDRQIKKTERQLEKYQKEDKMIADEIKKINASLSRKRNPLNWEERGRYGNKLNSLKSQRIGNKVRLKKNKKLIDKELESVGNDIFSQTGISNDIADAICMAFYLHQSFKS